MEIVIGGQVEFRAKVLSAPVTKRDGAGKEYWSFEVTDDEYQYPEGYDVSKALNPAIEITCSKTHPSFEREMVVGAKCYVYGHPYVTKEGAEPFGGWMRVHVWKLQLPDGTWV